MRVVKFNIQSSLPCRIFLNFSQEFYKIVAFFIQFIRSNQYLPFSIQSSYISSLWNSDVRNKLIPSYSNPNFSSFSTSRTIVELQYLICISKSVTSYSSIFLFSRMNPLLICSTTGFFLLGSIWDFSAYSSNLITSSNFIVAIRFQFKYYRKGTFYFFISLIIFRILLTYNLLSNLCINVKYSHKLYLNYDIGLNVFLRLKIQFMEANLPAFFIQFLLSSIIVICRYHKLSIIYQQNYKNIKVQSMKTRSHSVGVINLQKQIENDRQINKTSQFIPFVNERKLGKLIQNTNQNEESRRNKKETIDDINFKNFKRVYNRERIIENAKYSRLTRNSAQLDLIGDRPDWKVNKVSSLNSFKLNKDLTLQRPCCNLTRPSTKRKIQKFDKIDEVIYKKIAVSKPADSMRNPEIHTFFQHYIQACEMNENIRRLELVTKKKY